MMQQIVISNNVEFFAKHFSPLRTNTFEIFNRSIEDGIHNKMINQTVNIAKCQIVLTLISKIITNNKKKHRSALSSPVFLLSNTLQQLIFPKILFKHE